MAENAIRLTIVDDDTDDYMLIKELLGEVNDINFKIDWIKDSTTAIENIKKQQSEIYLIDYRIDQKTALDILDEIQGIDFQKTIILLTGKADREVDVAAMKKGASDFITKENLTSEVLERSIRYSLKRRQDAAKLKEAENLKIEKEASDAANKAKSQFLANMSHEIRTPLGSILGFAELALDPTTKENERTEFLKLIKRNGEHLLELINDILDISKIEAGHLQLSINEFDWRDTLNHAVELLKHSAEEKNIKLNFFDRTVIPAYLKSDPEKFRQILINLIGNAVKFTESGEISIRCERNTSDFIITIQDSGIGISPLDQKKLFLPFQQASACMSRKFGGTGLGLNLSRNLARALGGDVTLLTSSPQSGSTFALRLPAIFCDKNKISSKTPLSCEGLAPKELKSHVLLVEDSVDNQLIVKHFLKNTGIDLEIAGSATEGMSKLKASNYDMILMDLQMPEVDGYEATHRIREEGFKKPIIALTAHAMQEERSRALNSGFSDFLCKPISRKDLISTLAKFSPSEIAISSGTSR